MRIISGFLKSRILKVPSKSINIRPTTDRARETIFNILENKFELRNKLICDLFCGSGSFGIECISRGSSFCSFVDTHTDIVKGNISDLDISEYSKVIRNDVLRFLKTDSYTPHLYFADPPYDYEKYESLLELVSVKKALMILEHSDKLLITEEFNDYILFKKKIGISQFTFFDFKNYNYEK